MSTLAPIAETQLAVRLVYLIHPPLRSAWQARIKRIRAMKNRFRLYRRSKGGTYYVHDSETGKQESLGTKNRAAALSLFNARNESIRQPQLNLQLAKTYLAGTDSCVVTRTWQHALEALIETKHGSTQDRWRRAAKEE